MTEDEEHWSCSKKELGFQKAKVKNFNRMLVETFEEHCDYGIYTLKYQLLGYIVEAKIIRTAICFRHRSYEHFNMHIKQMFKRASYRRQTRMMKMVHVMERNHKGALPYRKEEMKSKLRLRNERSAKAENDEPYLVRDRITITVEEMARAVHAKVQRVSAASFASKLVEHFKESRIQIFLRLVQEVAARRCENVPNTEM